MLDRCQARVTESHAEALQPGMIEPDRW